MKELLELVQLLYGRIKISKPFHLKKMGVLKKTVHPKQYKKIKLNNYCHLLTLILNM